MLRTLAAGAILLSLLGSACGAGQKTAQPVSQRQPTDPRTVPTAALPAALASPVAAGTVTDAITAANATVLPSVYTVKAGDTLGAIAAKLGVPLQSLLSYNADVNPSALRVGQEIRIPPAAAVTASATAAVGPTRTPAPGGGITALPPGASATPATSATPGGGSATAQGYTVKAGDTACKIASDFHVSIAELAEANRTTIASLANLRVGQQLQVPAATGSPRGC